MACNRNRPQRRHAVRAEEKLDAEIKEMFERKPGILHRYPNQFVEVTVTSAVGQGNDTYYWVSSKQGSRSKERRANVYAKSKHNEDTIRLINEELRLQVEHAARQQRLIESLEPFKA